MYLFDFAARLSRLNPRLYVDTERGRNIRGDWWVGGIYLRSAGRSTWSGGGTQLSGEARQAYEAATSGMKDKFICGTSLTYVPEYDIFDRGEDFELLASGWRSILLKLIKEGLVDERRAKRMFQCSSLGEHTYDKLTFMQKQALIKREMQDGDKRNIRI